MFSPFTQRLQDIGIAQFDNLAKWKPQVGDFIIYNGWFKHWFGMVIETLPGEVKIVYNVLPLNVFLMGPNAQEKNAKKFDLVDITNSKGGKFTVIQPQQGSAPIVYLR